MLEFAPEDDDLSGLVGAELRSSFRPGVTYRVDRSIGTGGMSVAFLAMRIAPEGITPVVLKLPRPSLLRQGGKADLTMRKEAVALGRLNERVPATPYVVRLIEADTLAARIGGMSLGLPWLSIEYVHGGAEGTTLEQRVLGNVNRTGFAFDPDRAALAIDCMCRGVSAVHEVGIIHRDLTPRNVLCCGFGDTEIFKIVDFGLAKPVGMKATFGSSVLGTPGYAAPEQMSADGKLVGPWSDVFSLSCLMFFVLTGEEYFPVKNVMQAVTAPHKPERRRIADSAALCPEIKEQPTLCKAIDEALARGTTGEPDKRLASAETLSAMVLPLLRTESRAYRSREDRVRGVIASERRPVAPRWSWTPSYKPGSDRIIRSAGWDSDGHCLVATTRGLEFWNGIEWIPTPTEGLLDPEAIRFVHRMSAGRWLVGGDHATAAVLSTAGVTHVLRRPQAEVRFELACGEIDDLAVLIGSAPGQPMTLHAVCGGRWLKPLPLDGVASVSSLARLDDLRWLLSGRSKEGSGFAAIATPTEWEASFIGAPTARALLACAGHRDRGTGLVTGTEGMAVHIDAHGARGMRIEGAGDLASAAVDVAGMEWAGGAGQIWARAASPDASWQLVWQDTSWTAPLMSLFADVGIVMGLSVDGGVIEGRIEGSIAASPRRSKPW